MMFAASKSLWHGTAGGRGRTQRVLDATDLRLEVGVVRRAAGSRCDSTMSR